MLAGFVGAPEAVEDEWQVFRGNTFSRFVLPFQLSNISLVAVFGDKCSKKLNVLNLVISNENKNVVQYYLKLVIIIDNKNGIYEK